MMPVAVEERSAEYAEVAFGAEEEEDMPASGGPSMGPDARTNLPSRMRTSTPPRAGRG